MMRTPLAIVCLHALFIVYSLKAEFHKYIPDPRVSEWFIVGRWTPLFLISALYYGGVLIGPKLMQNKKAFTLTSVLKFYNLFQIALSVYLCKEFLFGAIEAGYTLGCQPIDFTNSRTALRMAAASWWYFFSKIVDTLDTVFFILRKKNSQISFLHVYHHGSMIMNWYFAAKYAPGGHLFFQCLLNSFVHVVMYTYYYLAACGPEIQKYLWWKKYLTQLQLIQFILIIIHFGGTLTTRCEFPDGANYYVIGYAFALTTLFFNFYIETYSRQTKQGQVDHKKHNINSLSNCNQAHGMLGFSEKKPMDVLERHPVHLRND